MENAIFYTTDFLLMHTDMTVLAQYPDGEIPENKWPPDSPKLRLEFLKFQKLKFESEVPDSIGDLVAAIRGDNSTSGHCVPKSAIPRIKTSEELGADERKIIEALFTASACREDSVMNAVYFGVLKCTQHRDEHPVKAWRSPSVRAIAEAVMEKWVNEVLMPVSSELPQHIEAAIEGLKEPRAKYILQRRMSQTISLEELSAEFGFSPKQVSKMQISARDEAASSALTKALGEDVYFVLRIEILKKIKLFINKSIKEHNRSLIL